ncbi:class II aldolase [Polynucleobacter paneuropaeus]|nr:class II aldolase [Polynucleobacter paneuropaeus]
MTTLRQEISQFSAELGKDRLVAQGAGGNVSWKEGELLWIKGSGTWLAEADIKDIFVPVNLLNLTSALSRKDFDIKPQLIGEHILRPSIETMLHALMPQKIVAHLHLIDALTYLVNKDGQRMLARLFEESLDDLLQVAFVQYEKPGPQLAQAIQEVLMERPKTNVIFLKNHGIVLGAESIDQVKSLLKNIMSICAPNKGFSNAPLEQLPFVINELRESYIPYPDTEVQVLALDPSLYKRLELDWVLYPDHLVFLGEKSFSFSSWADLLCKKESLAEFPELIFIQNTGVFVKPSFNLAKTAQLRCYYDVISRVPPDAILEPLSRRAINDLLNWDAEKYRIDLSR